MEERPQRRFGDLGPNPQMWEALERGPKLRRILTEFYQELYRDPLLAPFFSNTTIEWVIDHQYAFLADIFSGEKTFFGDRPRNAHHWMVISDEIFDYREELMQRCLERHQIPPALRQAWRAVEEVFRPQIVKDKPFGKKRHGVELPLEGYERMELSVGSVCDDCQAPLDVGASGFFHVRTGRLYCGPCKPGPAQGQPR